MLVRRASLALGVLFHEIIVMIRFLLTQNLILSIDSGAGDLKKKKFYEK